MTSTDPKIDAYIAKSQPFAQPVLSHLRELMHKGCPGVEETIKWSHPFFEYRGAIMAHMAAFKNHCSFGFWGEEIGQVLRKAGAVQEEGMGSLGKIASLKDLPSDKAMLGWIREASKFVESGNYTSPIAARRKAVKAPKPFRKLLRSFRARLRRTRRHLPFLTRSVQAPSANTWNGSPRQSDRRPGSSASKLRCSGLPKANREIGNIKTADPE